MSSCGYSVYILASIAMFIFINRSISIWRC
nr:MAG TPA: hypothetical protein [Caudoviricetes sp.]DAY18478.1 MAG TPA: hypothetical protein [Caudoviricetes sp.]